ncbi:ABC transporter ATP-binding protein [Alicyclobacillus tolerans]|uniref:ABC transporter ATP-binding protein n=1 Tax=Alicyclobacillus tolerans TaxID=90970 RepID=UPI003B78B984
MTECAIEVMDVCKKLGHEMVFENLNLSVNYGEIVGIIGSNGSGKTLLLRILSGLAYVDSGSVRVGDVYLSKPGVFGRLAAHVGLLIETPGFLPYLSGFENLQILAHIRNRIGQDDIRKTMELVGLDPYNRKPVKQYSLGMRQRLGLAQALMEKNKILLLDEPTNALDPEFTTVFLDILSHLKEDGTAIILTSHEMDEVRTISDKLLKVKDKRLILQWDMEVFNDEP